MKFAIHCSILGATAINAVFNVGTARAEYAVEPSGGDSLVEIVVTAQKREQRLIDVPTPVSVLSATDLLADNKTRLQDYFRDVPGLTVTTSGGGAATLAIRGISTGNTTNTTVGVTIDDVPYGSISGLAFGSTISPPDLDPSDLQRIEVLRGPQGTLYGASALGGVLKFVTADPSFTGVSGRVGVDGNTVDSGGSGGGVRGAVNIPLISDTLAMRASGFYRRDPGFIDDPVHGYKDLDQGFAEGGHLSTLWRISDIASLKIGALYQRNVVDGQSAVDTNYQGVPTYGDLQQVHAPATGSADNRSQLYSANLSIDLPSALKLVSVTGYGNNDIIYVNDLTPEFGPYTEGGAAQIPYEVYTHRISEEIRLQQQSHFLDWVIGAFYARERSSDFVGINDADFQTGHVYGSIYQEYDIFRYKEIAGFANATAHLTPKFDLGAGLRYAHNDQFYRTDLEGEIGGGYSFTQPSSDHSLTYSVSPSYKLDKDLLTYVRVASGYRPGGPNAGVFGVGTPKEYSADKTVNYEIGLKGDVSENRVTFDVSLFYVKWTDIQIGSTDPTTGYLYFQNGRSASSKGVELSTTARVWSGATLIASSSVGKAELTEALPATAAAGASGDRLPNSAEETFSLDFEQTFPITQGLTGFVGGSVNNVGSRLGMFVTSSPTPPAPQQVRPILPAYTLGGLRAGVKTLSGWDADLYVSNLGNERAVLSAQTRSATAYPTDPFQKTVAQPRTIGIAVSKSF